MNREKFREDERMSGEINRRRRRVGGGERDEETCIKILQTMRVGQICTLKALQFALDNNYKTHLREYI